MNLATIQTSIYDQLGSPATTDTQTISRVLRRINQVHRKILTIKGIGPKLRRVPRMSISTVANSPYVVLPQAAVRMFYLIDPTNNIPLDEVSLETVRYNDPGLKSTGANPYSYVILGYAEQVAADPSTAGQLTVVSDNAGDGATKSVFIEVTRTGGYYQAANVALNGVTPVNIGPVDSLLVRRFMLGLGAGGQTTAVGNIILKDGAGNELARIPPTKSCPRYTRLHLYPVPSTILTLLADVELHIEDLSQADDEPLIPEDFHDLIETGVLRYELQRKEKLNLKKDWDMEWSRRIAELRDWLQKPTGNIFSNRRQRRFSQLGSYFPSGS